MSWRLLPVSQLATWLVEGVADIYPWLRSINDKLEVLLSNQDVVNEYAARISAANVKLRAELDALKAQPGAENLDFSALEAAVSGEEGLEPAVSDTPVVSGTSGNGVGTGVSTGEEAGMPTPVTATPDPADAADPVTSAPVDSEPVVEPTPAADVPVVPVETPAEDVPAESAPAEVPANVTAEPATAS